MDELETDKVGRENQVNTFGTQGHLERRLRQGAMADDPVKGVQEPGYVRERVVMRSLTYVKKALTVADEDLALEIVMMVGCGLHRQESPDVGHTHGDENRRFLGTVAGDPLLCCRSASVSGFILASWRVTVITDAVRRVLRTLV